MRLFNLAIVDQNLQTLSLWHSVGRYFTIALVAIFTLCLGFLTVFFRKDRRGLHDIIANTYVIYK
jgi:uncharacterized RDD family membrane protein YckC